MRREKPLSSRSDGYHLRIFTAESILVNCTYICIRLDRRKGNGGLT